MRVSKQYGIANANQILLAQVTCLLWFLALLSGKWLILQTHEGQAHAGLWNIYHKESKRDTSWSNFCKNAQNITDASDGILDLPLIFQDRQSSKELCTKAGILLIPHATRIFSILSIILCSIAIVQSLYFILSRVPDRIVKWTGFLPGALMILSSVFGICIIIIWEVYMEDFDTDQSYSIAIAATVLSFIVGISMLFTWFWPGMCAVPGELESINLRLRRSNPPTVIMASTNPGVETTSTADYAIEMERGTSSQDIRPNGAIRVL